MVELDGSLQSGFHFDACFPNWPSAELHMFLVLHSYVAELPLNTSKPKSIDTPTSTTTSAPALPALYSL